jgi:uncharacterized iron-regulated membrane protein
MWGLHSAVGFWGLLVILMFAVSGVYLSYPQPFEHVADLIQPVDELHVQTRTVDRVLYWLAYLHFGRVNGIGIPCKGPGVCDIATKSFWVVIGLTPAVMFVTGVAMWWNRVVRKKLARGGKNEISQIKAISD